MLQHRDSKEGQARPEAPTRGDLHIFEHFNRFEKLTLIVRAPALVLELPYRERQGTKRGSAQQPPAHAENTPKWPSHVVQCTLARHATA
jgi:hypothetical protein